MSSASRLTPIALLTAAMVGCGATQAPRIDQAITGFIYLQTTCVQFAVCDLPPTVLGLPPTVQPIFTQASGTLPDGLTLDPATGDIKGGAATTVTSQWLGVDITALGYDGVFHAGTTLTVAPMRLVYGHTGLPPSGIYPVGVLMSPIVPVFEQQYMNVGYPLGPGVSATYTLRTGSTLPAGVAFDPTTGRVSGTPTQSGLYFSGIVDVHLAYRGQVVDLSARFVIPVS
jgi:hypothetical protein